MLNSRSRSLRDRLVFQGRLEIGASNRMTTIRTRTPLTDQTFEIALGHILFTTHARNPASHGRSGEKGGFVFGRNIVGYAYGSNPFSPCGIGTSSFALTFDLVLVEVFVGHEKATHQTVHRIVRADQLKQPSFVSRRCVSTVGIAAAARTHVVPETGSRTDSIG